MNLIHKVIYGVFQITGTYNVIKRSVVGVINDNGQMYMWSGFGMPAGWSVVINDMPILDTINRSWGSGRTSGAPVASGFYGATLFPGNKIIYIGEQVIL